MNYIKINIPFLEKIYEGKEFCVKIENKDSNDKFEPNPDVEYKVYEIEKEKPDKLSQPVYIGKLMKNEETNELIPNGIAVYFTDNNKKNIMTTRFENGLKVKEKETNFKEELSLDFFKKLNLLPADVLLPSKEEFINYVYNVTQDPEGYIYQTEKFDSVRINAQFFDVDVGFLKKFFYCFYDNDNDIARKLSVIRDILHNLSFDDGCDFTIKDLKHAIYQELLKNPERRRMAIYGYRRAMINNGDASILNTTCNTIPEF